MSQPQTFALGQQVGLRELASPVALIRLFQVPQDSHPRESEDARLYHADDLGFGERDGRDPRTKTVDISVDVEGLGIEGRTQNKFKGRSGRGEG